MQNRDTKKPHVLFYSPAAEFKGGAERSLLDLISTSSIKPFLVTPGEGSVAATARLRGVPVSIIPFMSIGDIRRPFKLLDGTRTLLALFTRARDLRTICRQEKIDYVHSNGLKAHLVAITARVLGAPPAIIHIRDIPLTRQERLVWRILQLCAAKLVLVSRACWPWKDLPSNASIIFNGIEICAAPQASPLRHPIVLGFFGRIHQAKGLHLLIEWLRKVLDADIPAHLVIRGTFHDEAGNYEVELSEQVRRLGLEGFVDFQPFQSDPSKVYEGIDVVCVPSHVPDPLPRTVMEAMALGLPVIAYPTGGILEMVDNGKNGFLAADAEECIAALASLLDPVVRTTIRHNAIERANSQFSLTELHRSIGSLYDELQMHNHASL